MHTASNPVLSEFSTSANALIFLMQIWFNNVPHTKLADVKGHQNWVKVIGEYLTFPGGGTQFIHGASGYINHIEQVRVSCISLYL